MDILSFTLKEHLRLLDITIKRVKILIFKRALFLSKKEIKEKIAELENDKKST